MLIEILIRFYIFTSLPFHLYQRTQNEGFYVDTEGKNILNRKISMEKVRRETILCFLFFSSFCSMRWWLPRPTWRWERMKKNTKKTIEFFLLLLSFLTTQKPLEWLLLDFLCFINKRRSLLIFLREINRLNWAKTNEKKRNYCTTARKICLFTWRLMKVKVERKITVHWF
jgi:hypothetical protein